MNISLKRKKNIATSIYTLMNYVSIIKSEYCSILFYFWQNYVVPDVPKLNITLCFNYNTLNTDPQTDCHGSIYIKNRKLFMGRQRKVFLKAKLPQLTFNT